MNRSNRHRLWQRGAAMLVTLALLSVIMLLSLSLLRHVAGRKRVATAQERRLQADYLAEAALERAAAKLARDPQYAGETWEPTLSTGTSEQKCQAVITLKRQPDSEAVNVKIVATFPLHPVNRAQISLERTLSIAKSE